MSHNSGRWFFGSHWPNSSRNEKMRSLARAFSSSRRAPPIQASKPNSAMVSSRVTDWYGLRGLSGSLMTMVPRLMESSSERTISRSPRSAASLSRVAITSGKLCSVSMCTSGNGNFAGRNAFSARRSITMESLPPENSSAGFLHSAATSRMMWMDSLSSASRWVKVWLLINSCFLQNQIFCRVSEAHADGQKIHIHCSLCLPPTVRPEVSKDELSSNGGDSIPHRERLVVRYPRDLPTCSPHSLPSGDSHHHLPERMSSPGVTALVHGAQPMLG